MYQLPLLPEVLNRIKILCDKCCTSTSTCFDYTNAIFLIVQTFTKRSNQRIKLRSTRDNSPSLTNY